MGSGSPASCSCSRGFPTRSTPRSRSSATRASTTTWCAALAGSIVSGSVGQACAGRWTTCARRARQDRGRVQQGRPLLGHERGRRLPGEPGIREPRTQRAARILATPARFEPREELRPRRRTAASNCGGTSSTCSTPPTSHCRTTSSARPRPISARSPTASAVPRVMQLGARVRF